MDKRTYIVGSNNKSERLDIFITSKTALTRSFVSKLIKEGLVRVNSYPGKTAYKVREGDCIEITVPEEPEGILIPENIPLDIIHENDYIIVINKPSRMVMYPAAGNRSGTMMNALAAKGKKLSSIGAPLRPGVVHRLDKDTSGIVVIAKDDTIYYKLVKAFREREVEKNYIALLDGNLKSDTGEIKSMIGRSLSDRKKMSTRTRRGKEAITCFNVIERFNYATLVKVRILTGRTHQIRVHFASLGNPVLGDKTYGKKTSLKAGQKTIRFDRQMLHAYSLKLSHPVSGKIMELKAPVPDDMKKAIKELKG